MAAASDSAHPTIVLPLPTAEDLAQDAAHPSQADSESEAGAPQDQASPTPHGQEEEEEEGSQPVDPDPQVADGVVNAPAPPTDQVPPEAADQVPPEAVDQVPPEAVGQVPLEAVGQVPPEAVDQVPPGAVDQVPPGAVDQVPPEAVDRVPPEAVDQVPPEAVDRVPPEAVLTASGTSSNDDRVEPTVTKYEPKTSSSPFRQSVPGWILAGAAIAAYCLTVCYAFGTTSLRYLSFTALNPSITLAVLRTLSEVTSLCLGMLIGLCTERALWMLVARRNGAVLSTFLALHPGSGVWAWIHLILRNARGGRSLSWLKMLLSILPPAMGVALLSQVDIGLSFADHANFPVAAGIGNFNATYALDFAQIAPIYMASDFSALLQAKDVSWSTPVIDSANSNCTVSDVFSSNACGSGYFLHGGLKPVTPWPTKNTAMPSAPVYTLHSVRGLQLDFTDQKSGARFQNDRDCMVFGTENGAIQICISQYTRNAVNAKYVHCPSSLQGSCLKNTSWQSFSGWTATMTSYVRRATVHYSRANLSTISVSPLSSPAEYPLSATEMLSVYNTTLAARSGLGSLSAAAEQFVYFVSSYLTLAETSSPTAAQAGLNLHNLLAMPLYYFQPTYMSPFTIVPSPDRMLDRLPQDQGLYITASLSTTSYGLSVAPWSVWLYIAVMGMILISCLFLLTLSSMPKGAAGIPDTTAWSFVDLAAECNIAEGVPAVNEADNEDRDIQSSMQRVKAASGWRGKAKIMGGMRVQLAAGST
jgi:hypothetical protein